MSSRGLRCTWQRTDEEVFPARQAARAMLTAMCRRHAATVVAVVTILTIIVDVTVVCVTKTIQVLWPLAASNVLLAAGTVALLWRMSGLGRRRETPPSLALPPTPAVQPAAPAPDGAPRALVPAPPTIVAEELDATDSPKWLCCLPLPFCFPRAPAVPPPPPLQLPQQRKPLPYTDTTAASPAHLLPPSHTSAIVCELLDATSIAVPCVLPRDAASSTKAPPPSALSFPLLRIHTTGADCNEPDITPSLAFCDATLRRGEPVVVLFDLRATGKLRPPPWSLVRKVRAPPHRRARIAPPHDRCAQRTPDRQPPQA
jgi:hypothetical protein